jgi:radical SAM superfamily enzyme YgiQ (UPF0313 family)
VRFRPIDHLLKEIAGLRSKGVNNLYFSDDTFGVNKEWLTRLCNELIGAFPGLRWSCEIHARLVDDSTLSLMKKAGCYQIELGVESGSDHVLRRVKKGITATQGLETAQKVLKHGLELAVYMMIGFPFETEEDLQDTYRLIRQLKNRATVTLNIFTPLPGTELFDFCLEHGLIEDDGDFSLLNYESLKPLSMAIEADRFIEIAREIQDFVDRSNHAYRRRRILSRHTLWRVKERGARDSVAALKKALVQRRH